MRIFIKVYIFDVINARANENRNGAIRSLAMVLCTRTWEYNVTQKLIFERKERSKHEAKRDVQRAVYRKRVRYKATRCDPWFMKDQQHRRRQRRFCACRASNRPRFWS